MFPLFTFLLLEPWINIGDRSAKVKGTLASESYMDGAGGRSRFTTLVAFWSWMMKATASFNPELEININRETFQRPFRDFF